MRHSRVSEISDLEMKNQRREGSGRAGKRPRERLLNRKEQNFTVYCFTVYFSGLLDTLAIEAGIPSQNCPPNTSVLIFLYEK